MATRIFLAPRFPGGNALVYSEAVANAAVAQVDQGGLPDVFGILVAEAAQAEFRAEDCGGEARMHTCRALGVTDRRVGGALDNATNDRMAAAAEKLVCDALGRPYHADLGGPDGGADTFLRGLVVDAKWGGPRRSAHLIVSREDRWADVYVLVVGPDIPSMRIVGWATADDLKRQKKDFGYGPRHAMHQEELRPFEELLRLAGAVKPGDALGLPWAVGAALRRRGFHVPPLKEIPEAGLFLVPAVTRPAEPADVLALAEEAKALLRRRNGKDRAA